MLNETFILYVYTVLSITIDPTITVTVGAGEATPMAGAMYYLICAVTGAESLIGSNITYQWFKDGSLVSGQTMDSLSFTSLTFSDAGGYTCEVTVVSNLGQLESSIWWNCYYHWLQDLLWQWKECISAFYHHIYWHQPNWKPNWSGCLHPC